MSTTIHIKIEPELYSAIKAISADKGVSVSDSVIAYLRTVAETNSLAIENTILRGAPAGTQLGLPAPSPRKRKKRADNLSQVPTSKEPSAESPDVPAPVEEQAAEPKRPEAANEKPEEAVAEQPEAAEKNVVVPVPPLSGTPVERFVSLICSIPDGLLSTWEELEEIIGIGKPLHSEWPRSIRIHSSTASEGGKEGAREVAIPYWRVLGRAGSTKGDVTCLREMMLTAEGHEIVTVGRGMREVKGYKKKLVKWE